MKRLIIVLIAFLFAQFCFGQIATNTDSENFDGISDSLLKREIAFFTIKGASYKKPDSLFKTILTEIPIRSCSGKEVHLWWSTFFGPVSTFIHLYFKGEATDKALDSIFLVTHSHFWVRFPRSAFQGLAQSNACTFSGVGKKAKFFSPYYKAFFSADKRRLYIYMQGGTDSNKYEVTWVIVDDKYYTRIKDEVL